MPIYEYRCDACGLQKDFLQKMSDAPLTTCPSCGANAFHKLLSAPGFQLTGSGWYATDFKGGSKPAASGGTDTSSAPATNSGAAPSGSCGTSCACH